MVELCSKASILNLPAGNVEGDSAMEAAFSSQHSAKTTPKTFNHKGHEGHGEKSRLTADGRG